MARQEDDETLEISGGASDTTARRLPTIERPQLIVLAGAHVGQSFPLPDTAVIGRGPGATLRLDDPEVSRAHAAIREQDDGTFVIQDLDSRNGTAVNGAPVDSIPLSLGDRIQLGSRVVLQVARYEPVEDQIRHRQRLETLGRLAAGFAHDLNNMLAIIATNLDYLEEEAEAPSAPVGMAECVADLKQATDQAATLTPRLLSFVRSDERAFGRLSISQICDEVAQLVRRTFSRSIAVNARIEADLETMGSATDLHQALMNLCINARDAMPDGGTLHLRAEGGPDGITIEVSDTGRGIDETTMKRIFEPFFTTKPMGKGSGLGLSTVREIVVAHGGNIEVDSANGPGALFRITLPRVEDSAESVVATQPPLSVDIDAQGTPRVLVVDDEPMVRRSLRRLLEKHGYQIIEAESGAAAVEIYKNQKPELVIMDLDMPELSGEQAMVQLSSIDRSVRILVLTGDPERDAAAIAQHHRAAGWLRKPAPRRALLEAVALALAD